MRIGFWIVAILFIFNGISATASAISAMHQIYGLSSILIGAVFIVGAEIINAINSTKE